MLTRVYAYLYAALELIRLISADMVVLRIAEDMLRHQPSRLTISISFDIEDKGDCLRVRCSLKH